ncbi:MAG: flagellar basal-body rod protein FlgF [Proteobacteria bacterium]|uniref:flagellar basal-body rod protein FlgF n=1 Tax=Aquabacterium sp. TaxID=1872578 RepID=UPI0035C6FCF3|nr:flagellar basal-body rod protein FlgF [Pseudomonadota bacterium]
MDRMIYLSMAGAKTNMAQQDVLSHNLANVNTTGFRAQLHAVRAVPVRGDGASTRVYSLETTVGYDDKPGPMTVTGRALDVAVQGRSWLSVQAFDGTEAYTRFGSLQVDAQGTLMTSNGRQVLGDGGPITIPPNTEISIGMDGTVSARDVNGRSTAVGRLKLVTPQGALTRGDDGLFRSPDGADLPADATARLQEGALEGSNVNPIETMVQMIAASRQYETQTRMVRTAEQNEKAASQLLSANG